MFYLKGFKSLKNQEVKSSSIWVGTLQTSTRGVCECPGIFSAGHLGKKYSKLIWYSDISEVKIFFFNHNTYKYHLPLKFLKSLLRCLLGGCLGTMGISGSEKRVNKEGWNSFRFNCWTKNFFQRWLYTTRSYAKKIWIFNYPSQIFANIVIFLSNSTCNFQNWI